jgi:hypothetical protein
MGKVITTVRGNTKGWLSDLIDVVIIIVLWLSLFLTFPNIDLFATIVAFLVVIRIIKTIVIRVLFTVTAIFTEDELIVKGRKGTLTIPRGVVTSSNINILCTGRRRFGFKLRVTYGSVDYTIPVGRWGYNRSVSRLREHWGWTPPECPST